jgi:hypothetical protein
VDPKCQRHDVIEKLLVGSMKPQKKFSVSDRVDFVAFFLSLWFQIESKIQATAELDAA